MSLKQYLGLGNRAVVSIVGAGGKTTFMFHLAHELADLGCKVLTTTTTKIFTPTLRESPITIMSNDSDTIIDKARSMLNKNFHLSAGAGNGSSNGKLIGLKPVVIEDILSADLFDYILIEADGAARRSLKACAYYEPVVPSCTDTIVSLAGLDVLGKPLDECWVFRSKIFSSVTGLAPAQAVTENSIAEILLHDAAKITTEKRSTQRVAFLNKADTVEAVNSGKHIAALIEEKNNGIFQRVLVGVLKEVPTVLQCSVLK